MLFVSLMLANAALQEPLPRHWAQFSRAIALRHVTETVQITTGNRKGDARAAIRMRLTRTTLGGDPEVAWTDDSACPAVRDVLLAMKTIEMPAPAPYGVSDEPMTIVLDGATYSLTAPSSDSMGRLTISSNLGTPLAAWADASLRQLESCWKPAEH